MLSSPAVATRASIQPGFAPRPSAVYILKFVLRQLARRHEVWCPTTCSIAFALLCASCCTMRPIPRHALPAADHQGQGLAILLSRHTYCIDEEVDGRGPVLVPPQYDGSTTGRRAIPGGVVSAPCVGTDSAGVILWSQDMAMRSKQGSSSTGLNRDLPAGPTRRVAGLGRPWRFRGAEGGGVLTS